MTLQRYLDYIEIQMMNRKRSFDVEYLGSIDEDALARAFELLCRCNPVLRARIRQDDKGYLLYVLSDCEPEFIVYKCDGSPLSREPASPWDPARGVARLTLTHGEERGSVALHVDHAIVDARSLGSMLSELWRLYTDVVNGSEISIRSDVSLPAAPSHILKRRWIGSWTEGPTERGLVTPSPRGNVRKVFHQDIRLSVNDTARLIAGARANNTTMHGLICGAVLVSLRALGKSLGPEPMVCWSVVDLRDRVTPPVGARETTNFLGRHRAEVTVPIDGNPLCVGRDVKAQLDSAIERRELPPIDPSQQDVSSRTESALEEHLAHVVVSNAGIMPLLNTPDGLTITDVVAPAPENTTATFPGYVAYTYEGQLKILCIYPSDLFDDKNVDQLVRGTAEQLRCVCAA